MPGIGLEVSLTQGARPPDVTTGQNGVIRCLGDFERTALGLISAEETGVDHHTVKPFLSARLGFSPPVSELQLPGCVFLGGRVDYLDGRPVAALVYTFGQHIVNAFIWPASGRDRAPAFQMERGFRIARWSQGDMEHWVISDVNGEEFRRLVQSMVSAGTPR